MRVDNRHISVQFKDGSTKRMPRPQAEKLIGQGKANFTSQSRHKAFHLGINTKGMNDKQVTKAIRKARKAQKQVVKAPRGKDA